MLSIWDDLLSFSDDVKDFIMNHYNEPFLWIAILVVLLFVAYFGISKLADK